MNTVGMNMDTMFKWCHLPFFTSTTLTLSFVREAFMWLWFLRITSGSVKKRPYNPHQNLSSLRMKIKVEKMCQFLLNLFSKLIYVLIQIQSNNGFTSQSMKTFNVKRTMKKMGDVTTFDSNVWSCFPQWRNKF